MNLFDLIFAIPRIIFWIVQFLEDPEREIKEWLDFLHFLAVGVAVLVECGILLLIFSVVG